MENFVPKEISSALTKESSSCITAALLGSKAIQETPMTLQKVKAKSDFVTAADIASENAILTQIKADFPGDAILSEESSPQPGNLLEKDRLWIVDPLDGTNNAKEGRKGNYVVGVGFMEKGNLRSVAVVNPDTNEVWFAQRGLGSFYNGRKMHVRSDMSLSDAYIGTDPYFSSDIRESIAETLLNIKPVPWSTNFGSAILNLARVAQGSNSIYFHYGLKPWDHIGRLLVEEAGGNVTDLEGNESTILNRGIIAGNPPLVTDLAAITRIQFRDLIRKET